MADDSVRQSSRLDWVDTAKGISIILVVMMHSAYGVGDDTGQIGILHYTIGWATPFRMPEFFMISGLFLSQVIDRPWRLYGDRRILHYLYFYDLWAVLQILFKTGLGTGNIGGALTDCLWAIVQPYGVLWFVYVLAIYSLVTRLIHQFRIPAWLAFTAAAVLQLMHFDTGVYIFDHFAAYFVFFFAGYAFAPLVFRLVGWAQRHAALSIAMLVVYAAAEAFLVFGGGVEMMPRGIQMGYASIPLLWLALAFAGALVICTTASLLVRFPAMRWLRWLGEHSIVIYLSFTIPMSAARTLILRFHLLEDTSTISLLVWGISLLTPVLLYMAIQKAGWGKFLFERPAWAHIPGTPGSRSYRPKSVIQPAE
jgi:uncharacterized membrane protein YcfT